MSLSVVVTDVETGEQEEQRVADGDYLLLTVDPCHVAYINSFPTAGTHVITIKGWGPRDTEKHHALESQLPDREELNASYESGEWLGTPDGPEEQG